VTVPNNFRILLNAIIAGMVPTKYTAEKRIMKIGDIYTTILLGKEKWPKASL